MNHQGGHRVLSPCDLNDCLISQSKLPEGDDIAITCFDIIFYYIALGRILYLLLFFLLTTHIKDISVYFEITDT